MSVPIQQRDIPTIKKWRKSQYDAGQPCGLKDFYDLNGICFICHGLGTVRWQNGPRQQCNNCGGSGRTVDVLLFPNS